MKLKLAFSLALFLSAVPLSAQAHNRFEIGAGAGARWGGGSKAQLYQGEQELSDGRLRLDPGFAFGFQLGYRAQPDGFAYLAYSRQTMSFHLDGDVQDDLATGNLSVEYFLLGGNVEWTRGIWVPYLGAALGASRWASSGSGRARLFFTAALDGGLKVDVHEHVHLRLSGRLPMTLAHGRLFCPGQSQCFKLDQLRPQVQGELLFGAGVSF